MSTDKTNIGTNIPFLNTAGYVPHVAQADNEALGKKETGDGSDANRLIMKYYQNPDPFKNKLAETGENWNNLV